MDKTEAVMNALYGADAIRRVLIVQHIANCEACYKRLLDIFKCMKVEEDKKHGIDR
jgi:hypothetical protein